MQKNIMEVKQCEGFQIYQLIKKSSETQSIRKISNSVLMPYVEYWLKTIFSLLNFGAKIQDGAKWPKIYD
jgi:hypothetical protein